jgi:membrane protein
VKLSILAYLEILWIALKQTIEGKYTYHASALAFTTLLALVPLLTVIVSIVTLFPVFDTLVIQTRTYVVSNFIPASSDAIQFYLTQFVQHSSSLPAFSITFLFITAWMMFADVQSTLNSIWRGYTNKKLLSRWTHSLLIFTLSPMIVGCSVFLSTFILSLTWIKFSFGELQPLLILVPLIINAFIFSLIYIAIPRYYVTWRNGVFGGCVTSVLVEITKLCFAYYIKYIANYELIYGTLAVIPIFLIWVYLLWLIILYGAVAARVRSEFLNQA